MRPCPFSERSRTNSTDAINDLAATGLELTVVVVPLVPRRDGVYGVPMLDKFFVVESVEVVEGAVGLAKHAFAYAEHEIALSEHSMDCVVVPRCCLGGRST